MTAEALDPQPLLRFLHEHDVAHITDLGPLDVMQWIAGVEAEDLYAELAARALTFTLDDPPLRCCGLGHLRAMKEAAGRPRDLDDLEHLPPAEP